MELISTRSSSSYVIRPVTTLPLSRWISSANPGVHHAIAHTNNTGKVRGNTFIIRIGTPCIRSEIGIKAPLLPHPSLTYLRGALRVKSIGLQKIPLKHAQLGTATVATLFVDQTSVWRDRSSMLKHERRTSRSITKMHPIEAMEERDSGGRWNRNLCIRGIPKKKNTKNSPVRKDMKRFGLRRLACAFPLLAAICSPRPGVFARGNQRTAF